MGQAAISSLTPRVDQRDTRDRFELDILIILEAHILPLSTG